MATPRHVWVRKDTSRPVTSGACCTSAKGYSRSSTSYKPFSNTLPPDHPSNRPPTKSAAYSTRQAA